jgi:hypothetical protein
VCPAVAFLELQVAIRQQGARQQGKSMMIRYSLIVLAGLSVTGPALAASWADAMFDELSKDFGSVPRGPLLTHSFRLTNNTASAVHISGVRVSCGCVTPTVTQYQVEPGQTSMIQAQMDTRRFSGTKNVTIYVNFDQPRHEEVRLWVQANSRDDITVTPDTLALGRIPRGSSPESKTTVLLSGNGQVQVQEVRSESNYVKASIREVRRDDTEISYELTAKLRSDAPVGRWFTDIWLTTDNPNLAKIRVPLTVEIESALSISPSLVQLGQVKMGGEAERKVIVRGVKPFRISAVTGGDTQVHVKDASSDSKPVHVLTVAVRPDRVGDQQWTLRILTDLPGESSIELSAQAQAIPAK